MSAQSDGGEGGRETVSRRSVLKKGGLLGTLAVLLGGGGALAQQAVDSDGALADAWGDFFQQHYKKMTPEEVQEAIARIERKAQREHGVELAVGNEPAIPGVVFGYALNISKCKGVRRCVEACVAENNNSRAAQIQYIRVLELNFGEMHLNRAEPYYDGAEVPQPNKVYMPIQCMQCNNPPCVKACPVQATWQ